MRRSVVLVLLGGLVSLPLGASAQIGTKIFGKGNVEAATKLVKAAVLTDDQVQALSLQSVQWMDKNNPVGGDDAYSARLKTLVEGLETEDGLSLNFKVYLVTDVNAFATPDGSIRVMAGLMKLMTDDELRSIIGHEIGHVKLKHSKKQYQKAYTVAASRNAAVENSGSASVLAEGELGQFVEDVMNAKFSRNDESEADEYGFKFLLKHGYDYHAMQGAFAKLAELSGSESSQPLRATHPDSKARAERAKGWAKEEDAKRPADPEPAPVVEPPTDTVPADPPADPPANPPADPPADPPTETEETPTP